MEAAAMQAPALETQALRISVRSVLTGGAILEVEVSPASTVEQLQAQLAEQLSLHQPSDLFHRCLRLHGGATLGAVAAAYGVELELVERAAPHTVLISNRPRTEPAGPARLARALKKRIAVRTPKPGCQRGAATVELPT
mmetsp:Transcript_131423/g.408583  ORF Transcript_131423/g.408583 Transcript_131423/m.408583 type:complete len:139 (-) Transcript_131423:83-499(-)